MNSLETIKKQLEEYLAQPNANIHELKDMMDTVHMHNEIKALGEEMRNQLDAGKIFDKTIHAKALNHYKAAAQHIKYKCVKTNEKDLWWDRLGPATLYLELEITEPTEPSKSHVLSLSLTVLDGSYGGYNTEWSYNIKLDGKTLSDFDWRQVKSSKEYKREEAVLLKMYCLLQKITGLPDDDVICSDDWNIFIAFLLSRANMPSQEILQWLPCVAYNEPKSEGDSEESDSDMTECE